MSGGAADTVAEMTFLQIFQGFGGFVLVFLLKT